MSSHLDNVLNDILSKKKGYTTTPGTKSSKLFEVIHHVDYMTKEDLIKLEKKIDMRRQRLEALEEQDKQNNPFKLPDEWDI